MTQATAYRVMTSNGHPHNAGWRKWSVAEYATADEAAAHASRENAKVWWAAIKPFWVERGAA